MLGRGIAQGGAEVAVGLDGADVGSIDIAVQPQHVAAFDEFGFALAQRLLLGRGGIPGLPDGLGESR